LASPELIINANAGLEAVLGERARTDFNNPDTRKN
jgi:hypothetical protein